MTVDEVAARYGYDVEGASLTPVYALVPQFRDPADGYARDLLARECLQGVVEYVPAVPGSGGFKDERTAQWVLDEATAQASGYPFLRPKEGAVSGVPEHVELTDEVLAVMHGCGDAADERLGAPPQRLLNDIEATGWFALEDSPEMAAAIEGWRACMAPLGLVDLPENPTDMPPASVLSQAGGASEGEYGALPLTDVERAVAVADARCLAEVDYYGVQHRVRAAAELEVIGHNLTEFEAARRGYESYQDGIEAVIAELG